MIKNFSWIDNIFLRLSIMSLNNLCFNSIFATVIFEIEIFLILFLIA